MVAFIQCPEDEAHLKRTIKITFWFCFPILMALGWALGKCFAKKEAQQ
jgi:hypothetical protein